MASAENAGVGMVIQPNGRGDLMVVNLVDGGPAKSSGQVATQFEHRSTATDARIFNVRLPSWTFG